MIRKFIAPLAAATALMATAAFAQSSEVVRHGCRIPTFRSCKR